MKNRWIAVLAALCMAVLLIPAAFAAGETSGTCGENVAWSLDNGVLTISGSGPMEEYEAVWIDDAYLTSAPWKDYKAEVTSVVIEDGVTSIGACAFYAMDWIQTVRMADSVAVIESYAFLDCKNLKTIAFSKGLSVLGENVFESCESLESINLPNGLQEIGDYCFYRCFAIRNVVIPSGVSALPDSCFAWAKQMSAVTLPYTLKSIGPSAFENTGLKEIVIPDSVTSIGGSAFENCKVLKTVKLSEDLTALSPALFSGCSSLTEIEIPEKVTKIGGDAFDDCVALETAFLPDSIQSIGFGAFTRCASLEHFAVPASVTKLEAQTFIGCEKLKLVMIPDSVISIGEGAFQDCTSLTYVRIPQKVTKLSDSIFDGCTALEAVTIPKTVKNIGDCAFCGCNALKGIEFNGTEKQLNAIKIVENGNDPLYSAAWYLIEGYPDAYYLLYDLPAEDNWAYPGIAFCLDNGIMNGMGNGLFQPGGSTTRAQLVTILYRLMGEPAVKGKTPFTDLKQSWYKNAVAWAYQNGVVNGMSKTTFEPDTPITREMMMTILYRLTGEYLKVDVSASGKLSGFPDGKKVSSWAKDGMAWGVGEGLISGVGTSSGAVLQPKGTATRAQIAKVIMSYCLDILEPALEPTEGAPAA